MIVIYFFGLFFRVGPASSPGPFGVYNGSNDMP
jgi:hypothetical protein